MNATTNTEIIIIKSTINSNVFAVEKSWTIPTAQIIINTIGRRYLIINFHNLPTLNVENWLSAGKNLSTP